MDDSFVETVSPVAAIKKILHDYPFSASILRELLQNSDDARATRQIFVLDMGDNPALMAYNDSQFQEEDWKAIQSIHESSKKADTSKIGKYGVGFRACYHVTDRPQILSGSSFALLDPLRSGGKKIGYDKFKKSSYREHFNFFSRFFQPSAFPGTVIRLPLRSSPSELSQCIVLAQELDKMIKDYIAEELNITLLFLDSLRTIEIWEASGVNKIRLAKWTKSEKTVERQNEDSLLSVYDSVLSDGETDFSWRIVRTHDAEDEAKSHLSAQVGEETVNHIFKTHKLRPDMRIAYPLFSDEYTSGRLFTFLPLPSKTDFPVHIHALFALTSSRQSLRNRNETGIVPGSDNDVLIKWNSLLFDYYIPQAWSRLLKTLAEDDVCEDIFDSWPPYCSSITSGDGLYWQDILPATFDFAVQSDLAIWPKVSSETDTTTYVNLKSALVVARGQVDSDVLIALAQLGLTLVQLPQIHMGFLDGSITELTPQVARDQLKLRGLASVGFDGLSENQRRILCGYFLSNEDFSDIYGLPLFPVLGGLYISIQGRKMTNQRHVALLSDEVDLFGESACDAISLDQLQPEVAALVQEKGTTQANIDLLSPPSVIAYLSCELEPRSEEYLSKFWSWLSERRHKEQTMTLLKTNTSLRLIPTSKGPQLVSSPVFSTLGDSLFEKLGLAFISPLPSNVVQFLGNYGVVRDTDNMQDFVAAIDLMGLQPLSDDEAKSVFDHISLCYKSVSRGNLTKLKKLPIFPVLVHYTNHQHPAVSNTSIEWRPIGDLSIKGISPMSLLPLTEEANFLDMSSLSNPTCSLFKALRIPVLQEEDVLLLALGRFSSQAKALRASFVSYIRQNHRLTYNVTSVLRTTRFIRSLTGSLQSPSEVIDPNSGLRDLFPADSGGWLIPAMEDHYDRLMLKDLRSLKMMQATLSFDMVQERISYISSNRTLAEALSIAHSLVSLMNAPTFNCFGISVDPSMCWLPTHEGLVSSKECIDHGRQDTDLFDQVLFVLDESITVSPSFRALVSWDKPLPLDVITIQLDLVLGSLSHEVQYRKVRRIIQELASRQLGEADIKAIQQAIAERPWVPTESGSLALPTRAVFASVPSTRCFYEIGFSRKEEQVRSFLLRMGCHEWPSISAIIGELGALRKKVGTDRTVVQQAVQLLEMLPDPITEEVRASLLVPIDTGDLVPLHSGVCYYGGGINIDDGTVTIAHHLVTEKLAEKIGMRHLGLDEAENDIDLGGKPITIIRNTLKQYDPRQFFTEFIANASDAGAKQFNILIDEYKGPKRSLLSEALSVFQGPSLVIHNDGIFSRDDFRGILHTGVGGKRQKKGMIGHFGLGALSMFHFTEFAMIVSGDHVLFISPSKRNLSFCGKHSLLLPLQSVKRLYTDHLQVLNGLFDFDLSSTGPYQGTLFRLPLRNELHSNKDSVWTMHWSTAKAREMLITEFGKSAYKSLLFTGLGCISIRTRRKSKISVLHSIESTREAYDSAPDDSCKYESVGFKSINLQVPKWLVITMAVDIPASFKTELAEKYDMHHLLPMRIAATLDSSQVQTLEYNLFCTLPLPVITPLPAHISAPLMLEQERRNVRIDSDRIGLESEYNQWLLSSQIPQLFLCLLEKLLEIRADNIQWWPGKQSIDINVPSKIFLDAFWNGDIIKGSSRRIFAGKYNTTSFLSPKDAIIFSKDAREYSGYGLALSKVFSVTQPPSVVELPKQLFEHVKKMELRSVDAPFLKNLLIRFDQFSWLDTGDIRALLSYLSADSNVSLDGLSLIPLEDGSYAKVQSQFSKAVYVVGQFQTAAYELFPCNRLVHRTFTGPEHLLARKVNVANLSDSAVVGLVEERIKPGQVLAANEADRAWIASFWDAHLNIPCGMIAHLPLIPTLRPSYFISMNRVDDASVTVVDSEKSAEGFDYAILQKVGMTVVHKRYALLAGEGKGKAKIPFRRFLDYMERHPSEGLKRISRLESSDLDELGGWVRLKFSTVPQNSADVARKLPVWPIQQRGKPTRLGALNNAIILPPSLPSDCLLPFTDFPVINWDVGMRSVKQDPCSASRIAQLLRVSSGTSLSLELERTTYKRFIRNFMILQREQGFSLLVPNEEWVLTPVEGLFERHRLFLTAFSAYPERLLSDYFQDIAGPLAKYGLNLGCRLDLPMFIECARAFDQEREDNSKRERSEVLYQYFNGLSLQYGRDAHRCSELDQFKFIPRDLRRRPGFDGIDPESYMRHKHHVLSPSEIVLHEYEAICWSQRGQVNSQPNPTLCGTYKSLGVPTAKEVVEHLRILAEIGQTHGRHSALLTDLKATYKWLNDHVDDISTKIINKSPNKIFLNVDSPDSDEWAWHSASSLVKDLQDVGDLHDVKGFLRNYDHLLKVAGVRTIKKVTAKPVAAVDKTSFYQQQLCDLRERGFETTVTFKAKDDEYEIPPAHKTWLLLNSDHFWQLFITAGLSEAQGQGLGKRALVEVPDYSSLCVKETIDWIYIGELSQSITSPFSSDEEGKARLDLALEMLSLAHFWTITGLHERLQEFIINADFINPYWVKDIYEHAKPVEAKELLRACEEFEEKNREIIDGVARIEY